MAGTESAARPLDDIMLAMDVVDTLRHDQLLVERELGAEDRDLKMMARLREIYAAQGIDVPDNILEQGVAALKEGRFTYSSPAPGLQVTLARLYVSRGRWGRPLLLFSAIVVAAWLVWSVLVSGPAKRSEAELPTRLQASYTLLLEQAEGAQAIERSEALVAEGRSALKRGDTEAVESTLSRMAQLREDIESSYTLRIANHPGERSGVWRIPAANPNARNHYIIVEAVDQYGATLEVPVLNEEDGKIYRVRQWGLRVDQAQFEQVAADKNDDGIIQNNQFGLKRRGYLTPDYSMPTSGAAITNW